MSDQHDNVFVLNEEQWADFIYHMNHPKPPTPQMIAGMKLMHKFWLQQQERSPGAVEYASWASNFPKRIVRRGRNRRVRHNRTPKP